MRTLEAEVAFLCLRLLGIKKQQTGNVKPKKRPKQLTDLTISLAAWAEFLASHMNRFGVGDREDALRL